jgi:universal stress protein A
MKFKPTRKAGGLLVELGPRESQLPLHAETEGLVAPGFVLNRILVPVDFSACSRKALYYAAPFAKQFGAQLTLIFVLQSYPPTLELADIDPTAEAKAELEDLRTSISHIVPADTVLRRGEPYREILRAASELQIDLIILSTHGRSGAARMVLGSTAEKVVRHAGCPVLVVRENEREFVAQNAASVGDRTAEPII